MVKVSTNVNDPVADLLTRIRNGNTAYKDRIRVPVSKVNEAVLKILVAEGYLSGFHSEGEGIERAFNVDLKYGKGRSRTISGLKRISTPGRRVYAERNRLPRVLGGLGVAIVSTSQGVMTDKEASRRGIGGEVLAYVW
jgi:small subunit ribosomal protein S8